MQLFFGKDKIFTFRTKPSILFPQSLCFLKKFKTLLDGRTISFISFWIFFNAIKYLFVFFFDLFMVFSPIKLYFNFSILICHKFRKRSVLIIRQSTSIARLLTTINTWTTIFPRLNQQYPERLFFQIYINYFFKIIFSWIHFLARLINFLV